MKDKGKIVTLFLIGSEALFFIALIVSYVYYRNFNELNDSVAHHLAVKRAGALTVCLVASSFTLMWSKTSLFKQKIKRFKTAMGITILLGIIFLAGQVYEYIDLYRKEITVQMDVFGSSFFTLTGFHMLHVTMGIIMIAMLFGMSFSRFRLVTSAGIRGVEVYWHFVDVVWLFIYFYVYITPIL